MSYAESEAVFLSRAKAAGLVDGVIKKLMEKDVKTFAILAFASEYNPGAASEKPLIDTLEILGGKQRWWRSLHSEDSSTKPTRS